MKADFKRKLMGLLKLKHVHLDPFTKTPSFKEALSCKSCGEQIIKAEMLYKKMRREHPEEFIYKQPEFIRSKELEKDYDMLSERVKNDKLYQRHLQRLVHGTEQEKDEEVKKSNEGYYQTHYEERGIIKEIKHGNKQ